MNLKSADTELTLQLSSFTTGDMVKTCVQHSFMLTAAKEQNTHSHCYTCTVQHTRSPHRTPQTALTLWHSFFTTVDSPFSVLFCISVMVALSCPFYHICLLLLLTFPHPSLPACWRWAWWFRQRAGRGGRWRALWATMGWLISAPDIQPSSLGYCRSHQGRSLRTWHPRQRGLPPLRVGPRLWPE